MSFHHEQKVQFSFLYDTVQWANGFSVSSDEVSGDVLPQRINILPDGRLSVEFQSTANFRGHFRIKGSTVSLDREGDTKIEMILSLLQSESKFDNMKQDWRFISSFTMMDYAGNYMVKLSPCVVSPRQSYDQNAPCLSEPSPLEFKIPIEFQQINEPLAIQYTLGISMNFLSDLSLFLDSPLEDPTWQDRVDSSSTFSR